MQFLQQSDVYIKLRYILLGCIIFLSCLSMIYLSHLYRHAISQSYELNAYHQNVLAEHNKLLLEHALITSYRQLEKVAVEELMMYLPTSDGIEHIQLKK